MSDKILRNYVQVLGRYSAVVLNLWTYRYNGILPYICNILYSIPLLLDISCYFV